MKTPHFKVEMLAKGKARIEIYDEIGPSWAGMIDEKTVARALKEIGEVAEIEVRVNSLGGDAYDGLAICNMLKSHSAKCHAHVEGIAASAATLILMGCDTITIPKNALMMIHDPVTFAFGDEDEMRRRVEQLVTVKSSGVETYAAKNTKKTKEEIAAIMKAETWYTGEEAVEAGFADQTEAEVKVPSVEPAAPVKNRFRNAPSQYASLLAISMRATQEKTMPVTEPVVAPVVPIATEKAAAPIVPVVAPVVQAVETAKLVIPTSLTQDDVNKAAALAATQAIEGERNRANDITALCGKAGRAAMANEFIGKGTPVKEVQDSLFNALCTDRKPSDDGGTGVPVANSAEPDSKYKAEYAKQKSAYMALDMSEEDYVKTRRLDEGIDQFKPCVVKEKAAA